MMHEPWLAFFLFSLVAAVTPGPSNVMVMAAGARGGFVGGLPCLGGVVAGMALLMAVATLGLGALVQSVPLLLWLLRGGGALMLLWLAWRIATAPVGGAAASGGGVTGFWPALAFQWVNPKSWIVGASAAATFGTQGPAGHPLVQAAWFGMVFVCAAAPACALWLGFGAAMQRWLADPVHARRFNRLMGLALAASVAMVLV